MVTCVTQYNLKYAPGGQISHVLVRVLGNNRRGRLCAVMSQKAYRYRFYPAPEQEQALARTSGCVRYVYNRALAHRSEMYRQTGKGATFIQTSAGLTKWKRDADTSWLKEPSSVALQQALRHLDQAYVNFFAGRAGYPSPEARRSRPFGPTHRRWRTSGSGYR